MKINTKYLIFFIILAAGSIITSVFLRLNNDRSDIRNQPEVKGLVDYSTYPSIQNIPPSSVYVGQSYIYDLAVIDSDTHYANITLEIVEGPKWLVTNGLSLIGTPSMTDIGDHKVVIKLNDGKNSVFNTFYIVVQSPYENN